VSDRSLTGIGVVGCHGVDVRLSLVAMMDAGELPSSQPPAQREQLQSQQMQQRFLLALQQAREAYDGQLRVCAEQADQVAALEAELAEAHAGWGEERRRGKELAERLQGAQDQLQERAAELNSLAVR
jgi:hypothetical protein